MIYIIIDGEQSLIFFWDKIECEHEKRGHARGASGEAARNKLRAEPERSPNLSSIFVGYTNAQPHLSYSSQMQLISLLPAAPG